MPAFIRILDICLVFSEIHVDDIKRARIFTGTTAHTDFSVNHRRHMHPFPLSHFFILDRQEFGFCLTVRTAIDYDLAEPLTVVGFRKV